MSTDDISVSDAIIVKALLNGTFTGPDGNKATLTVKGFVGANIIAARLALLNIKRPITEDSVQEIVKFLKDAETALDMLNDPEDQR